MRKFSFRLQKVLDYKRTLEENAKQAYLDAQRRTREVDLEIERLELQQSELLTRPIVTIGDRLALDAWLNRCDDEVAHLRSARQIVEQEEEQAREAWIEARREAEALEKLKFRRWEEWSLEAQRQEQAALDEWATMRRKPA